MKSLICENWPTNVKYFYSVNAYWILWSDEFLKSMQFISENQLVSYVVYIVVLHSLHSLQLESYLNLKNNFNKPILTEVKYPVSEMYGTRNVLDFGIFAYST